jgi:hypothetical protein
LGKTASAGHKLHLIGCGSAATTEVIVEDWLVFDDDEIKSGLVLAATFSGTKVFVVLTEGVGSFVDLSTDMALDFIARHPEHN